MSDVKYNILFVSKEVAASIYTVAPSMISKKLAARFFFFENVGNCLQNQMASHPEDQKLNN